MKRALQLLGMLLVVMAISGIIDHLWVQPIISPVLNAFERYVFPNVGFMAGWEIVGHVVIALAGIVLIIAGDEEREKDSVTEGTDQR